MPARAFERDFYFQQINSQQGLAQNGVRVIHQDDQGYIWLATQGGLHRYDGYRLTRFRHDASRDDSLPGNMITGLADAGRGELWVGMLTGDLVRFDPAHDRARPSPSAWARRTGGINELLGGDGTPLWIAANRGLFMLSPPYTKLHRVWSDPHQADSAVVQVAACTDGRHLAITSGSLLELDAKTNAAHRVDLQDAHALSVLCRHDGSVLIGTTKGLLKLLPDGTRTEPIWPADAGASATAVTALAEDHEHRLWLAVAHLGLVRIGDAGTRPRILRPQPHVAGSLPEASIDTLFIDRSGMLWAGTLTRGAVYGNPDATPFRFIFDPHVQNDPAAANNVRTLHEEDDGSIWFGFNGSGLRRYDPIDQSFSNLTPAIAKTLGKQNISDLIVYAIQRDGADQRLLGTNRGLLLINAAGTRARRLALPLGHDLTDPNATTVFTLLRARDGGWWIGLRDQGLVHYTPGKPLRRFRHDDKQPDSLASDTVVTLARDRHGRVWIGTTAGLSMYDPDDGRMRTFREDPERQDSLSGQVVTNLMIGDDGAVWVGTQSGLNRLERIDTKGAHFRRYLMRDGLPDSTIYCIGEDHSHRLWLSSNLGIARLDPITGAVRAFTLRDGLQGMEYNSGACMRDHAGRLWFGGVNGANVVAPDTVSISRYRPETVITGIAIGAGSKPATPPRDGSMSMPQGARSVRFSFAAMDFAAPLQNRFQYRLVPFDRHWIDAGHRNSTVYTNLDAGDYRFEVRGSNHQGVFVGSIASLRLTVVPPWWASPAMRWVYAALTLLMAAGVVRTVRARRAHERHHQVQLRERERRLSTALWGSGDDFWDVNLREGRLFLLSAGSAGGSSNEEALDLDDWANYMVHPDDLSRVRRSLLNHLDGHSDHFEVELRLRGNENDWVWTLARGRLVERDGRDRPLRLAGTARDITLIRKEERDRRIASEIISNMSEAVTVTDLGFRFVSVNAAFTRMTGYAEGEIAGLDARLLNCPQQNAETYENLRNDASRFGHWHGELWQRRKDGSEFLSWAEISEVCDASGVRTHFVAVLTDITDRKRAEQELRYLANYDTLTGLPNRTLLGERLSDAILRARRSERRVAVLYIDLDRFKHVNDSMGHSTGDRLLKAAGLRLRQCLREHDTVARVGGDEFTLIVEKVSSQNEIEAVCRKIVEAFVSPLILDTHQEVLISPSIGVAVYPDHGKTPHDLVKHADTAMYQAKDIGRNTWMIYTDAMDAAARLRATMASALRRALANDELSLVYQPKQSIGDGRILGVEALLRWHNERLGEVAPSDFIPLAEETGAIVEIGEFVLDRACADLRRWCDAGLTELGMAVNLSMAQLQRSELASKLKATLARHGIAPHQLELELTESTVMGNIEQSMRTLGELKGIGVTVAIDDFGTGYSSLSYLKRLPIDTLKIDQTFISDITVDPDDEAIIATIVTMAHSLGLNVVAEGVENEEQVDYLRGHDCDMIQGHWLSVPLPADACLRFCHQHAARATEASRTGADSSRQA